MHCQLHQTEFESKMKKEADAKSMNLNSLNDLYAWDCNIWLIANKFCVIYIEWHVHSLHGKNTMT